MLITQLPIEILTKLQHLKKALSPIEVTLSGIFIEVKLEQQENAKSPIFLTPSGIVTDVKFRHSWKA